jgi:hypothetical protein
LLFSMSVGIGWLGKEDMAGRLIARDGRSVSAVFPENIAAHVVVFGTAGAVALIGIAICSRVAPDSSARSSSSIEQIADEMFLWIWAGLVIAFAILATPFLAIRHLLPGIPPLVWIVLRRLEESFASARPLWTYSILGATTVASTICGFLVAKADYDFAQWYRHLALDVASRTVAAGADQGKTVWYTGHWGWAYYAERVGIKPYIPGETHMREGDFLLLPQVQTWQLPPKELYRFLKGKMPPIPPVPRTPKITGVAAIDSAVDWCVSSVRSISNEVHLYGPGTLTVPWRFSRRPLDLFNVIEVQGPD